MQRFSKALNVESFTRIFFLNANIGIYGFYTDRRMKLQQLVPGPFPPFYFRKGPGNEVGYRVQR